MRSHFPHIQKKAYRFSIHTHSKINDNVKKFLGDVVHTRPEINFRANSKSRLKPTEKPKTYQ